jgi:hypothetical protein
MAGKNKPRREQKKPKKSGKQEIIASIITPSQEVEVVRKPRKPKEAEET